MKKYVAPADGFPIVRSYWLVLLTNSVPPTWIGAVAPLLGDGTFRNSLPSSKKLVVTVSLAVPARVRFEPRFRERESIVPLLPLVRVTPAALLLSMITTGSDAVGERVTLWGDAPSRTTNPDVEVNPLV